MDGSSGAGASVRQARICTSQYIAAVMVRCRSLRSSWFSRQSNEPRSPWQWAASDGTPRGLAMASVPAVVRGGLVDVEADRDTWPAFLGVDGRRSRGRRTLGGAEDLDPAIGVSGAEEGGSPVPVR